MLTITSTAFTISFHDGIEQLSRKVQGLGGVIVLNHQGVPAFAYNTPRMARAFMNELLEEPVSGI